MPDGSSSEAPVTTPGPMIFKRRSFFSGSGLVAPAGEERGMARASATAIDNSPLDATPALVGRSGHSADYFPDHRRTLRWRTGATRAALRAASLLADRRTSLEKRGH